MPSSLKVLVMMWRKEADIYAIPEGWMGLDAGHKSRDQFNDVLLNSRTILWNGPIGVLKCQILLVAQLL